MARPKGGFQCSILVAVAALAVARVQIYHHEGFSIDPNRIDWSHTRNTKCQCWQDCLGKANCSAVTMEIIDQRTVECDFTEQIEGHYFLEAATNKITYTKVIYREAPGLGFFYITEGMFIDLSNACPDGSRPAYFSSSDELDAIRNFLENAGFTEPKLWIDMTFDLDSQLATTPNSVSFIPANWSPGGFPSTLPDRPCLKFARKTSASSPSGYMYYLRNSACGAEGHRVLCKKN